MLLFWGQDSACMGPPEGLQDTQGRARGGRGRPSPASLQRQVSDGVPEGGAAGRRGAAALQPVCFSRAHDHVALGAWGTRTSAGRRCHRPALSPAPPHPGLSGGQSTWGGCRAGTCRGDRPAGTRRWARAAGTARDRRERAAPPRTEAGLFRGSRGGGRGVGGPGAAGSPAGRRSGRGGAGAGHGTPGRGAPTWQLPRVAEDGDRDEDGRGPRAQEARPPGADPQRALGGQLRPAGRGVGGQRPAHTCPGHVSGASPVPVHAGWGCGGRGTRAPPTSCALHGARTLTPS